MKKIDSIKYLYEQKRLPPKSDFFSSLSQTDIDQETYHRLEEIFKEFNCKNMGDFIRIYCILDVILLVEIWTNFIDFSQENYNLNPEFFIHFLGLDLIVHTFIF